jgi:hypothetical protein
MTSKLNFQPVESVECDALVVIGFEDPKSSPLAGLVRDLYESKVPSSGL